jgi:hypothetical protein
MIRLLGTSLQSRAVQLAVGYRQLQQNSVCMQETRDSIHTTQTMYIMGDTATNVAVEKQ